MDHPPPFFISTILLGRIPCYIPTKKQIKRRPQEMSGAKKKPLPLHEILLGLERDSPVGADFMQ